MLIDAVAGKEIKRVRMQTEKGRGGVSLALGAVLTAVILCSCIPKQITNKPLFKPTKKEPGKLLRLAPERFNEEITKLEIKLMLHDTASPVHDSLDTTSAKDDIMIRLFDLYIHKSNPEPNYRKAITVANTLIKRKVKNQLYYYNWRHILRKYMRVTFVRDSLDTLISAINDKNKSLQYSTLQQTKQNKNLSALVDSLSSVINEQKKTIESLKALDVQIERQRSRMQ